MKWLHDLLECSYETMTKWMLLTLWLAFPLGIWKLVELVLWLFNHVSLGIK